MAAIRYRDWRELAEAARREKDPKKLLALVEELNRALERRMQAFCPRPARTLEAS
jgi:hypothetical protein